MALSLFTTQSTSADLEKIHRQIKRSTPAPANFNIGASAAGPVRAVFPVAWRAAIQFNRQTGTAPVFTASYLPTPALAIAARNSVGQVAYGTLQLAQLPDRRQLHPGHGHAHRPCRSSRARNDLTVQCSCRPVPSRPAAGRWRSSATASPTASYGAPWTVASMLAAQASRPCRSTSWATAAVPLGTLNVMRSRPARRWWCLPVDEASIRTATAASTPPKA